MSKRLLSLTAAAAIGLMLLPTAGFAQEVVGAANRVDVWAYQTAPGQGRADLFTNDQVVQNAAIKTVPTGAVLLTIKDGTQLFVGPSSEVTLDEFIFEDEGDSGSLKLRHVSGALRFVTGKMRAPSYRINIGVATIGIRGTDITIRETDEDERHVYVDDGAIEVTPNNLSTSTGAAKGQVMRVTPDLAEIVDRGSAPAQPSLGGGGGQPGDIGAGEEGEPETDEESEGEGSSGQGSGGGGEGPA